MRQPDDAMQLLDLTLPTPEENLALDETLLFSASRHEVLRFWEPPKPFIVLGRSSRLVQEVDIAACRAAGVPIHRRVSGGGAIVAGPGCLMYALTLDSVKRPELRSIDRAHAFVLRQMTEALRNIDPSVVAAGTSDLAFQPNPEKPLLKFSGNSLRVDRNRLLYHGTLLYDADLPKIARVLRGPPRQPEYRASRGHEHFLGNLPTDACRLRRAVREGWPIADSCSLDTAEMATVELLVRTRYARADWKESR